LQKLRSPDLKSIFSNWFESPVVNLSRPAQSYEMPSVDKKIVNQVIRGIIRKSDGPKQMIAPTPEPLTLWIKNSNRLQTFWVYKEKDIFERGSQVMLKRYFIDADNDDDNDTDEETFENAWNWVAFDLAILAKGVGTKTFYDEAMTHETFSDNFSRR